MEEPINKAKAIFLAAIDEYPPEQWPTFLEQACAGEAPLRAEVERLLRAHAALEAFHGERPCPLAVTIDERCEQPGTLLGPYKLLEEIGEGGFGIVFLAEQEVPIRRRVALKVLKPGMDTRQVIARFEVERHALALMDHPNIARVLDAGATPLGRPYFVMELVSGMPITDYCDRNRLSLEARLRLFLDVCHAIQHAHHKGVIHRDIKPTNVLVTVRDGVPVVKVIDFGVAKAVAHRLTEETLFTAYGQMIGTPAYMSPEQAERSGLDIDTRSDVYALGVLLYELLTGTTPLEEDRLRSADYAELQRLICEEDPPQPSTRLSSLGASATALAVRRGLSVKQLSYLLTGDLSWVVMKALEKDRSRRYDTPGHLAEDLERYLRREAILARPPATLYRLKKIVQRHRASVLTAAAVAAALLLGLAVATWQAVRAMAAEAAAHVRAEAERQAKEEAEAREAETRAVLCFVEDRVFAAARPKGQDGGLGREVTLRKAIEAALPFVEKSFTKEPLIEARLRMTLGQSFSYLGEPGRTAEQFQAARTLYTRHLGPEHPDTLRSMGCLARSFADLGQYDDALKLRAETLALQKARLGAHHPDTLRTMSGLACSYADLGRRMDALQLREETLPLMKAHLGPDHPDTLTSMYDLAASYDAVGRQAEALRLREETLALRKVKLGFDHPDTLRSMNGLAISFAALGRHADAVKLYQAALTRQEAKLGANHPDTFQTMYNLAISYSALGQQKEALRLREEGLVRHKARLGLDHPRTLMSLSNVAWSYGALGRHADALRLFKYALALQKARLGPSHPDTLLSMWGVADSLVRLQRGTEALTLIDEWIQLARGTYVRQQLLFSVLELRLRQLQKARDGAGCRQTTVLWESCKYTDADSLYKAACMRAVTAAALRANDPSAAARKQVDAETERAMDWLRQAVAAGYKNAARLEKDHDLDALRGRKDFASLVAEVKARLAKK